MTEENENPGNTIDMALFTQIGRNVRAHVADNILFIAIDITEKGAPSSTGKTMVRATTSGNIVVPGTDGAKLGLNYYTMI